jgi:ubiquinone/menaquinone biosynthesis C-methylase UbiE
VSVAHAMLPETTHDEASRQAFAGALRKYSFTVLEPANRALCEGVVAPRFGEARDRRTKQAILVEMEKRPEHQLWHRFMQDWQDMLWRYAAECIDRQLPALVEKFQVRAEARAAGGSLTLNPDVRLSPYQTAVDNHHFPGSYYSETRDDDVRQGAVLDRAAHTYLGNQLGGEIHDRRGQTLLAHVRERWPGFAPKRILDLGCMTGTSTVPWARAFPDAEVYGLDTAAPVLRYAHARSEALGAPVHYVQANAEDTGFDAESFDLIVSHVFLHETSHGAVRTIFAECRRLLRPGGIMAHLEVPFRAELFGPWDYIRSAREGRYNQEPFWIGVTKLDLAAVAREAGFENVAMGYQATAANGMDAPPGFAPLAQGKLDLSNWFVVSGVRPA